VSLIKRPRDKHLILRIFVAILDRALQPTRNIERSAEILCPSKHNRSSQVTAINTKGKSSNAGFPFQVRFDPRATKLEKESRKIGRELQNIPASDSSGKQQKPPITHKLVRLHIILGRAASHELLHFIEDECQTMKVPGECEIFDNV